MPVVISCCPPEPSRDCTAAVIVLYHPDDRIGERISRVAGQVATVVLVSNHGATPVLNPAISNRIEICNRENRGLAAALNQGLSEAKRLGYAWCLLLDQDTYIDHDLVEGLADVYRQVREPGRIGLLVPNYRNPDGARAAYETKPVCQELRAAVTSGSLLPLLVLDELGGMKEEFFIEGIDTEFCLRLRAAGRSVFASGRPLMTHGAGAAIERRLFRRRVLVSHHSPERYFLQYRNLVWTLRHFAGFDPRWACESVLAMLQRIVLLLAFEQQRAAKLVALGRGIAAGLQETLRGPQSGTRGTAV
jgi:rhamnosyltransferase